MKSYLLEIFKRDLSDAAIDFRQEWEKAFSEVNRERAQYQAAVNLSTRIQSLAEQVEERLVLRGKIIVWRPLIEAGLQQWQSHFDSKTQELAARLQQHQEVLKQLVSRIRELSAEQFDAEQRLKQLQDLDQQQAEYDCRFALLTGGRGQLEADLAAVKEQLEAQITLLGQIKSRSVDDIRRDLQQRQQHLASLQRQKETLADNLYQRLAELLSDEWSYPG